MAQLPYSEGVPSVLPRESVPDDYQHINMPAGAGGGLIARGLQTAGEGVTRAAEAGIDWAQFAENVNVGDQFNHTVNAFDTISYGDPNKKVMGPDGQPTPDTGYFGLQGRAASDQREATIKAMEDARQAGRKNLKTAKSQLDYDRQTRRLFDDRIRQIGAHADQQWKVWAQGVNKTGAEQSMANYLRAVQSGDEAQQNRWGMDYVKLYVQQHQLRLGTIDSATSNTLADEAQRDLLKQKVMFVGAKDPTAAQKILEDRKDIAGPDYAALSDHLRNRVTDQKSVQGAVNAVNKAATEAPQARSANMMGGEPQRGSLVTVTAGGKQVTVHSSVAPQFQGFLNELTAAGAPITDIGSYNDRNIRGTNIRSQHAYGNAIDIDQTARDQVNPAFRQWVEQNPKTFRDALNRWGMISGGDFSNPDLGHFEAGRTLPASDIEIARSGGMPMAAGAPQGPVQTVAYFGQIPIVSGGGATTPEQQIKSLQGAALRNVYDDPQFADDFTARERAVGHVNQMVRDATLGLEISNRAEGEARDKTLLDYGRALKEASESPNPQAAVKAVLDHSFNDPNIKRLGDVVELDKIARAMFQYDPPEKYGDGYADLLKGIFKGQGEPGYVTMTDISRAFGDHVITKTGYDVLTTTYARAHTNKEYAASHNAFSNMLQKYREQMGKEQMIPGLTTPITNLAGLAKFHDFAARMSSEFDTHMTKAGANPYEFINNTEYWDKVRDAVYPPKQRHMDELSDRLGQGTEPISAAPAGVEPKAWDAFMKEPRPVASNGKLMRPGDWAAAVSELRAHPEDAAAWDAKFPDFKAAEILAKLGAAPAGAKATKTEQRAVFTPAIGGAAPAAAEPAPARTGFERSGTGKPFAETAEEAIRGAIRSPEAQRPPPVPQRQAPLVPLLPVRPAPAAPAVPAGPGAATQAARAMHDALTRALTPETPRKLKHPPVETGER